MAPGQHQYGRLALTTAVITRRVGARRGICARALAVALIVQAIGLAAVTADALPAGVIGPRSITSASPFPKGCGVDLSQLGYGDAVADAETEPHLAVDPRDERNLLTAWMQDLYQGYAAAWSANGGLTWHTSRVPGNSPCTGSDYELAADPWLSIGPDGTAYLSGISLDLSDSTPRLPVRSRIQVNRSNDGGRTWSEPSVIIAGTGRLHDKPSITADPHVAGQAYAVWTEFLTPLGPPADGIYFSRTTDAARTWSQPMRIDFPQPPGATPQGALLVVLADESLLTPDDDESAQRQRAASPDPREPLRGPRCSCRSSRQTETAPSASPTTTLVAMCRGTAPTRQNLWLAHSHDGGSSWEESHVGGPFDLRRTLLRRIPVRGRFVGDYHGLVPVRGGFVATFALGRPQARVGGSDIFWTRVVVIPGRLTLPMRIPTTGA
jgi:hypothetical protein